MITGHIFGREYLLQLKGFRISQREEPYIRVNTRDLDEVSSTKLSTLYTLLDGLCYYYIEPILETMCKS